MNLLFLRNRLIRILTRPPEILYVISRHWILIAVAVVVGSAFAYAKVKSSQRVYKATAVISVSRSEGEEIDGPVRKDLIDPFVLGQVGTLRSAAVVRQALEPLMPASTMIEVEADDSGDDKEWFDRVRGQFTRLQKKLSGIFDDGDEGPRDRESLLQKRVDFFIECCEVNPIPGVDEFELVLYGVDRESLKTQLLNWIGAHRSRLRNVAEERNRTSQSDYMRSFQLAEDQALQALERHREEHPDVSSIRLQDYRSRLLQIAASMGNIETQLTQSPAATAAAQVNEPDPEVTRLEARLAELLATGRPETSEEVKECRNLLGSARERAAERLLATTDDTATELQAKREQELRARFATLVRERDDLFIQYAREDEVVTERNRIQQQYDDAHSRRVTAEQLRQPPQFPRVDISQAPYVGGEPYNFNPLRTLALGILIGFFLGGFLALLLEVLYSKVRFKHDITADFGLPVIAVFPR